MKISYVSDLHLEFMHYPSFVKEKGGDILILAGDIVTANNLRSNRTDQEARSNRKYLSKQLKPLCDKYTHIFQLMGNHEHYGHNFSETKNTIVEAYKDLNLPIRIFNNDYQIFDDWLFIGSTLWTDYNKGNPLTMQIIHNGMNDYRMIGADSGPYSPYITPKITPEFILNEHLNSVQYIREIINQNKNLNVCVFTHMCPTFNSVNTEHSGNQLDAAYCSDLSEFILEHPQIKYWIHGHTHHNVNYMVGECNILSNQLGYYFESSYKKFKGLQHIEV
jgi:Icc-related predicted phosphoesterase